MRALAGILAATALALATSCGGDDRGAEATASTTVRRLPLSPLRLGPLEPRTVASYTPDDPTSPWRRKRDHPIPVVESEGRKAARLDFDHPVNLRVDAPHRTTEFDRVDLELRIPRGESTLVRVTLFEGRRPALVSDVRTVVGTGGFERESFLLPGIERLDLQLTEITVQVPGDGVWVEVSRMDVLDERGAALLARPGDDPALADVGGQMRRGWGIDRSLGASLELPNRLASDALLRVSYATRPRMRGAQLRIEGLASGPHEFTLNGEALWRSVTLPVARADAGREVRLTVVGSGPQGAFTPIAEVRLEPVAASGATREPATLVLLVTSDTHRGDHVGRGGTPGLVRTPTLDALGIRGVQFTDAYAPANITNPSHVALMTGLSPRDTRIVGNRAPLAEDATTIAERFADAGWATAAAVSVQHIGAPYSGLGQGFDRYDGLEERTDYAYGRRGGDVAVSRAVEWIDELAHVPLFLWVHVFDVHGPYEAPAPYEARYEAGAAPPVDAALDPVPSTPPPAWIADDPAKRGEVRAAHARYRAAVDHLDRLLRPLLEHPRARAGVTAFTSDHGESFGRHELWWTHHGLYRDQLHVPLLLAAPGLSASSVQHHPVELIGLGRTLLDLAGVDAEGHAAPGLDLDGSRPPEPRFALGYAGHKASIAHEGWLLQMTLVDHDYERGPRSFRKGDVELYHVAEDPMCEHDRSTAEPDVTRRLRTALVDWLAAAKRDGFATTFNLNAEAERKLLELGYAGASESSHDGAWYVPD